jgi:hypothetical protein
MRQAVKRRGSSNVSCSDQWQPNLGELAERHLAFRTRESARRGFLYHLRNKGLH